MQVVRVISGDHELCALDFQKHYRLPLVHLMDTDRSFEKQYNRDGWPFLMLLGPDGSLQYQCNNLIDREEDLLKKLSRSRATRQDLSTPSLQGIDYQPATLKRSGESEGPMTHESLVSLAADSQGRVILVFTTHRENHSDVIARVWDGNQWSEDIAIAATEADEYDGSVTVDAEGQAWMAWTSNAQGDRYNIYLTDLETAMSGGEPLRVTEATDDAMHGRMACDSQGRLWVTYYQWQKNRSGISRDKEVFVRRLEQGQLSPEVQISPTDVPSYEDHTDPVIVASGSDMVVCWSWDYHRPKGYTQEVREPTIFARSIDTKFTLGKPFHIGTPSIDMMPVLATSPAGKTWCAWDCLHGRSKRLMVRALEADQPSGSSTVVVKGVKHVCSPSFAFAPDGEGVLVWSQTQEGRTWTLMQSNYDPQKNRWAKPKEIVTTGNPRYSAATYDSQGRLWIAYSQQQGQERRVMVKSW